MTPGPAPAGPPGPGVVPPYAPAGGAGAVTAPEAGPDTRPTRRRGPLLVAVAASVVLVVGAGTGVALLTNGDQPGDGDAADPLASAPPADGPPAEGEPAGDGHTDDPGTDDGGTGNDVPDTAVEWGVPTTTEDCPAADIEGADAACVVEPECWGGMVVITGNVSITAADCRTEHVWETFAIAPLPADGLTHHQAELAAHPTVREVCSAEVLAASLNERGREREADSWEPDVLPPTEARYAAGSRVLRCVAASIGPDGSRLTRHHFGPAEPG
ncbi:hypothetical protein LZF96_09525 [Streptomyces sp. ST2-7A]|nr:hypothetical protein [Streptomyces sp. ST2-7A]